MAQLVRGVEGVVMGMRAIAVTGWLVIVGALLLWQGIGLVRGPEWPTPGTRSSTTTNAPAIAPLPSSR